MKRKPWRRIKIHSTASILIRKICCAILILELAFLLRESGNPSVTVRQWQEAVWMEPGGEREELFGLRLRLKEGILEFYQKTYPKEAIKNTH